MGRLYREAKRDAFACFADAKSMAKMSFNTKARQLITKIF